MNEILNDEIKIAPSDVNYNFQKITKEDQEKILAYLNHYAMTRNLPHPSEDKADFKEIFLKSKKLLDTEDKTKVLEELKYLLRELENENFSNNEDISYFKNMFKRLDSVIVDEKLLEKHKNIFQLSELRSKHDANCNCAYCENPIEELVPDPCPPVLKSTIEAAKESVEIINKIIVVYVDVGQLPSEKHEQIVEDFKNKYFSDFSLPKNVKILYIPRRGMTSVEQMNLD